MSNPSEPERPHEVPAVDFELDTYELVLLRRPETALDFDGATRRRLQGEHNSYLLGLQATGLLRGAGAISGHPSLTGLGLFSTGSLEEARRLAEADPAVKAGLNAVEVMNFVCPKEALIFPRPDRP